MWEREVVCVGVRMCVRGECVCGGGRLCVWAWEVVCVGVRMCVGCMSYVCVTVWW